MIRSFQASMLAAAFNRPEYVTPRPRRPSRRRKSQCPWRQSAEISAGRPQQFHRRFAQAGDSGRISHAQIGFDTDRVYGKWRR